MTEEHSAALATLTEEIRGFHALFDQWRTDHLREHASAQEAVKIVRDENAKWREAANEWRSAMTDREDRFASRVEVTGLMGNLTGAVRSLEQAIPLLVTKEGSAAEGKSLDDRLKKLENAQSRLMGLGGAGIILAVALAFLSLMQQLN